MTLLRTTAAAILWALSAGCLALALRVERPRRKARITRYEVDGLALVSDVYVAPLSEAECLEHIRRLQFSQLGPVMARAMRRPAPSQASA